METELASRLIHSADERTHVDDLGLGVEFLAGRRALAGVAVLELHSPEGAFEQIEAYLRERGFFAPGGEAARGGSLPRLRPLGAAAPHERRRRRRSRARCRSRPWPCGTRPRVCPWDTSRSDSGSGRWTDADYGEAVEAVRAAIGRGDVYQVNLVQHLAAPFDGSAASLAGPARRVRAAGARR